MVNNKQTVNIDRFLLSINNMLESKYILIDRRISDILLAIADTHEVYNLIAECMVNFDFKQEWKNATTTNVMKLPATDEKRISFIFCLLNNIDDKNLDATNVLERYFSYDSSASPYDIFCKSIIAEFCRLVCKKLDVDLSQDKVESSDESLIAVNVADSEVLDEFEALAKLISDFSNFVISQKKLKHCFLQKNDLIAILSTFEQVVLNRQVEYFYSYGVTIKSAIEKNKVLKAKFADASKLIDLIIRGSN